MKNNKKKKVILVITFILLAICVATGIYVSDYYQVNDDVYSYINNEVEYKNDKNTITLIPKEIEAGLILYPGAKVESEAYIPIVEKLAENGVLGIIVKMPAHMAFMDINAADSIMANWPEVNDWYISGHSLGGVVASSYAKNNADKLKGIILLASYSTKDLSQSGLTTLSIYGSNDLVLNLNNYKSSCANLPDDTRYIIIEGGNHAQFGLYGQQKGDGIATISTDDQFSMTSDEIMKMIFER